MNCGWIEGRSACGLTRLSSSGRAEPAEKARPVNVLVDSCLTTTRVFICTFLFFRTVTLPSCYAATRTNDVLASIKPDLLRRPFRSASPLPATTSDAISLRLLTWKLPPAGFDTFPVTRLGRRHASDAITVQARNAGKAQLELWRTQTKSMWTE
jgi:hypothetical protein